MNHPIKLTPSLFCVASLLAVTGCGESQAEKMAKEKERQRIEAEEQAQRDIRKANKAITEMGKKLSRPARTPDLNLPEQKKTSETAPSSQPKS